MCERATMFRYSTLPVLFYLPRFMAQALFGTLFMNRQGFRVM